MQFIVKTIISALLIATISTVSRRLPMLGAIIASLPLTSILAMIWLYTDTQDIHKVIALSQGISWIILPSLVFFIAFQLLLRRNIHFYPALAMASLVMIAAYYVYLNILGRFGVRL
ncbi:MAG: hypothetical protein DDT35_00079 [Firmicutes bacterium]|nr:hypothetical protein [Bacillota bacterium]